MLDKKKIENDRFLRALALQKNDRPPVWIMRQAGRYLPEYLEIRRKAKNFLDFCKKPELACEATLQPLRRFDFDAAILFSDILCLVDAFDLGVQFLEGEGPVISKPIQQVQDIERLTEQPTFERLDFVFEAVQKIRGALGNSLPLIGFAGSPWTLACYMIEGSGSKTFSKTKAMLYREPEAMKKLLQIVADATARYLEGQAEAGADALMIFDTWGSVLSPKAYQEFSLSFMQKITSQLKKTGKPVVLFSKGCQHSLEAMLASGCQGLGVDWTISFNEAVERVGGKVALQGNLDPCVLYAHPEVIAQEVRSILQAHAHVPGHIFNLGHGIYPDVSPDHVKVLVETVKSFST